MKWLFILGHMRSGSSLLVHLLNSNPEVLGYGETPIRYWGRWSFVELHDHVHDKFETHGEPPGSKYRYVMDKILWPHIGNRELLTQVPLNIVVIVRTPKEALPSILGLGLENIQTPKQALTYYEERLEQMREILSTYDSPFVLTTYGDLTDQTDEALLEITKYLALDEKLTPTYETMWSTGKSGIGDPSDRIEAKQVQSTNTSYNMDIDPDILERAQEKLRRFRSFCDNLDR